MSAFNPQWHAFLVRGDTYGIAVEDFVKVFHQGKKKNRHWKEPLRLLLWPQGGKPRKRDTKIDVDAHLWNGRAVSQITDVELARLLDRIVAAGSRLISSSPSSRPNR